MAEVLKSLDVQGPIIVWLSFALAVFWRCQNYYFKCLGSNTDRKRYLEQLESPDDWRSAYYGALQKGLKKLDDLLKPTYSGARRPGLRNSSILKIASWFWSARSFGVHLSIAFIYPLILLLLFWVFSDANTSGIEDLFPNDFSIWRRCAVLFLVLISFFSIFKSSKQRGWKIVPWMIAAFFSAFLIDYTGANVVASVVVGVVAIASAVAVAGEIAGTGTDLGTIAGAGAASVAVVGALTIAFAGSVSGTVAFASAAVFAGAVIFAEAFSLPIFYERCKSTKKVWFFFIVIILFVFVGTTVSFGQKFVTDNKVSLYLLIFMVTIPIVNAIFDYLSLGLTRYLLQKSLARKGNLIWYACVDFFAACIILVMLSLTLVVTLAGLNLIASSVNTYPIQIKSILDRMRLDNQTFDVSIWWIYLMIFSTFLPTFTHAGLALGTLPRMRVFRNWRSKVIQDLKKESSGGYSHQAKNYGALYLTIQLGWTIFMTLMVILTLGLVLYWFLPGVGRTILSWSEWLAREMGENIIPGTIRPFFGGFSGS